MADQEMSQFTEDTTPLDGDFVGGYLGSAAGVAGGNRRFSFTTIATYVNTKLGLGTMSTQAASAVAITGGTINSAVIGGSTPAAATTTTLTTTGLTTLGGGLKANVRVVTGAGTVTVTAADYIVIVNKASGAATAVSLPAGVTNTIFIIKDGKGDANVNNITVTPAAGTIDGSATDVLNNAYGCAAYVYNGTQWNVLYESSGIL